MSIDCIQILIEVDNGEFHAFQCASMPYRRNRRMSDFVSLVQQGYVALVGDEYILTQSGKDLLGAVSSAARAEALQA